MIDIGANLTHQSFRKDEDKVIERALNAGVNTMIVTGSGVEETQQAVEISERYSDSLYFTSGVHPHLAKDCTEKTIPTLKQLAQHKKCVAIGETGLDYNRNFSPVEEQRRCFEAQLSLAAELNMPVFLHERDAHDDFVEILTPYLEHLPAAVIHCFTGNENELKKYIDMDLHVGITGWICDERRGFHLRDIIHLIPSNRLMIETDAPYLLPRDLKPKPKDRRNEPSFLPHIVNTIAQALGKTSNAIIDETSATARTFFQLKSL